LIDTAGRMHTKENLMREMEKISRVIKPDLKIFVAESITGNDVTEQAKVFSESVGIDGIILSKADVDEKGGAVLSVGYVTRNPILYLGTGQNYENLEKFDRNKFLKSLGLE
jgi:fused signal recognition particle receptor